MNHIKNLVGNTYSRLTVIEFSHRNVNTYWKCLCSCGNTHICAACNLKSGSVQSCGCLAQESKSANVTHAGSRKGKKHYLYTAWLRIKTRCHNKKSDQYPTYGARGIAVHKDWLHNFVAFRDYILSDLGERPTPAHTLDRIDSNRNYEPENLRWATKSQQSINRNRNYKGTPTSKYRGVCRRSKSRWQSAITVNNQYIHLGWFSVETEAALAYNKAALVYHEEFAKLNVL